MFEEAPKAELHPTMKLYGTGEAVVTEAFWERPASALVTVDSVGDSVMGQGNTRWLKTPTLRCKGKSQEGARIQFLEVHLPVLVMYRDCDGPKTWVFTVYGGPASGKYEHVLYENGVATRKGAHWLQAVTRIGGGDVPGTAVRYMESKIMEYVAKQQRGMLGGRTHIKVEDNDEEEEEPEPKKYKADPPKRKSKASTKAAAVKESDSEALVETLADAVRQAAEDACKLAVQAALKPKRADAKVQRLESDNKALRDRLLRLKDMEQCERDRFADLSDKYAKRTAESAQLKAENERVRNERDTARAQQFKAETEVERPWALVQRPESGSPLSQSPSATRSQVVIPSPTGKGLRK